MVDNKFCILYGKDMDSEILKALREREHISGEELGKRLQISRTAVWKHINKLRGMGYQISSSTRKGYSLVSVPDLLLPEEIETGLDTEVLGRKIVYYHCLNSTQDAAKQLAGQGEGEGTVVIADTQTHGKGRQGRRWSSPPRQGIYLSIILRPELKPSDALQIPLIAGVAVTQAIEKATPLSPRIKWPNDIIIRGKKAGGILTEMSAEMDGLNYVVLGIGLNVNNLIFPKEIAQIATSLAEQCGGHVSRVKLLRLLLGELESLYRQFTTFGFEPIRERWKALSNTIGAWVELSETEGKKVKGKAIDIDLDGALILQKKDRSIRKIFAGDVSLTRP